MLNGSTHIHDEVLPESAAVEDPPPFDKIGFLLFLNSFLERLVERLIL